MILSSRRVRALTAITDNTKITYKSHIRQPAGLQTVPDIMSQIKHMRAHVIHPNKLTIQR